MEKTFFKIIDEKLNWEQAITSSAQVLLENNYFNKNYVNEMIENINKFGSYIVIMPKIALPHASSSENVFKGGYSITLFKNGIDFNADSGLVFLLITLSSTNNDDHLTRLKTISSKLLNKNLIDKLLNSKNSLEMQQIWNGEL